MGVGANTLHYYISSRQIGDEYERRQLGMGFTIANVSFALGRLKSTKENSDARSVYRRSISSK